MTTPWGLADFDAHEDVHFFTDEKCGLKAIIAIHSTHLGPAAGGCRFWHYAKDEEALVDALRLSRGMSYKNAMAGLPLGGGKGVILAGEERQKTPDMLHAFGKAVDQLGGRYITAEDVGMSVADMIEVARRRDSSRAFRLKGRTSAATRGRTRRWACSSASRPRSSTRSARTASRPAYRAAGRGQRCDGRRAACLRGRRAAVDRRRRPGESGEACRCDGRRAGVAPTKS